MVQIIVMWGLKKQGRLKLYSIPDGNSIRRKNRLQLKYSVSPIETTFHDQYQSTNCLVLICDKKYVEIESKGLETLKVFWQNNFISVKSSN